MAGILDLLNSDLGKQIISGASKETRQPEDKTAQVVQMALPLLMGAMKRNANNPQGAAGLMSALDNKHDGSILDNLSGFFGGGVTEEQKSDGLGILGHVLGGSQDNVVGALSKKSGMNSSSVMQILQVVAPIALGYLGKQNKSQNASSSQSGLGSLLGGMLGGGRKEQRKQQSLIETLLDGDGDGSVVDDIAGMIFSSKKKKGGLLGSLFGR